MLPLIALALFCGLLIYAACTDIAALTIANWVSIALVVLFIILALASGLSLPTIGMHVLFGFAVLAVGFFLFQANILGGGDAKLMGAVAVWTGFAVFPTFALWMALAGGVLALTLMMARNYAVATPFAFVNRLLTPKSGVPYGVAIMIGGLIAAPVLPLTAGALTLP